MGKKGTPHRKWSKEEKLRYVRLHLEEHIPIKEIERRYGVGNSLVAAWVKRLFAPGRKGRTKAGRKRPIKAGKNGQKSHYILRSKP